MIAFIVGMAAVGFVMAAVAGTYLRGHVNPADYATEEAYRAAWEHAALKATTTIRVVQLVSSAILFFILAQRAGFAGRACLLILIPVIGTIVAFRILWRWTDIHHWERTVGRPGKSYFRWDRPNLMRSQQQYV